MMCFLWMMKTSIQEILTEHISGQAKSFSAIDIIGHRRVTKDSPALGSCLAGRIGIHIIILSRFIFM